jgi:DNA polymerase III sliding clamp (beta) subunit (PCNA family)
MARPQATYRAHSAKAKGAMGMQVLVNGKELGTALKQHAKVCKSAQAMQSILRTSVLMSATENELTVTSSNLTQVMTTRHLCTSDGATVPVLVDVSALRKALQAIKGSTFLEFPENVGNGVLIVRGGGCEFRLSSSDPVCFPALPERAPEVAVYTFTASEYLNIIGKVAPSMDRVTRHRLEFQGVTFRQREHLEVMATDSRRLAVVTLVGNPATPGEWIIPAAAIDCFIPSEDVTVTFEADSCRLRSGDVEVVTLLIAAEFPDVASIIPTTTDYTISMDREQLRAALLTLGAKSGSSDVVVSFDFDTGNVLKLATTDNTAATTVHYDGDAGGVHPAFFAGQFLDGVVACDPVVTMGFDNDTQPVVLRGNSFLYLVMPHHGMED